MDQATLDQVATILHHPFRGMRKTDVQLARAALTRTLGWRRHPSVGAIRAQAGSLADGLQEKGIPVRRQGISRILGYGNLLQVITRRWYLLRRLQVDQGNTPWCVDATRCHWQLSRPTFGNIAQHPLGALYRMIKEQQLDPWPNEDGTSAEFMLMVCQQLGLVESSWVYSGPSDADAALRWLTEVGGLWFGALWPEDAFRTDAYGRLQVTGPWLYGHEVFVIGRQRNWRRGGPHIELVNSWGRDNYGIDGRAFIPEQHFFDDWMHPDRGWGDLYGVVERAA